MSEQNEFKNKLIDYIREQCLSILRKSHYKENLQNTIQNSICGNYFTKGYQQIPSVENFFNNNIIELSGLEFHDRKEETNDDYLYVLKKLQNIHFINCTFKVKGLSFDKRKIYYYDCKFPNGHIVNNCEVLNNKNVVYSNCIFHQTVYFSPSEKNIMIPLFEDCEFQDSIQANGFIFEKPLFLNTAKMKTRRINQIILTDCIFKSNFIIDNASRKSDKPFFHINKLDLTNTVFKANDGEKAKVKIQFCEIKESIFYNTTFHDLADFYQTKFHKVNFERADFLSISVFSETEFMCDVDFKYVKFFGEAIFRDTVIKGILNLRDTIFKGDANFLDITSEKRMKLNENFIGVVKEIKVANRETARVIKSFYDYFNNIIEANKFYALEMKEREKELKFIKNPFEWLVFKFHKSSSDHSQDWLLALFWIINITFLFGLIDIEKMSCVQILDKTLILLIVGIGVSYIPMRYRAWVSIPFTYIYYKLYLFSTNDSNLDCFSKNLNPFSIMKGDDPITFGTLLFKIIIAYLIYQLIISIRQNTRRK